LGDRVGIVDERAGRGTGWSATTSRTLQLCVADVPADRLGDPWTGGRVEHVVTVSPQGQTNVLEICASTGDRAEAADVANAYATAVTDVRGLALRDHVDRVVDRLPSELAVLGPEAAAAREALQDHPTVSFVQPASVPSSSDGLPPVLVLAIALAAAVVLAPAAALQFERLGPRRVPGDGDLAGTAAGRSAGRVPRTRGPLRVRPDTAPNDHGRQPVAGRRQDVRRG
jgi:hypothetical protein